MILDVKKLQTNVGTNADGALGRGTLSALFAKLGAKADVADELGLAANVHFRTYGILDNPLRLIHFLGQCGHESGGFRYMEEIWGPTPAQERYEGRDDLGNTVAGDGFRYKGRGPIQETGRDNYRRDGRTLGLDFERHPEMVAFPSVGLLVGCLYWSRVGLNTWADRDDGLACGRGINRGNPATDKMPLHVEERAAFTLRVRKLVL